MMTLDQGFIVAALIIVTVLSVAAVRAEQALWRKCRPKCSCLRAQQRITLGKSHCR